MTLRLNGSSSGYTEIDAPAVAGSNTLVLPTGNGSNGQVLTTNGSGVLSWSGMGPAARAYASADLVVTSNVNTKIQHNTETYDTNSCFDTSLYRFTPTIAGYYSITVANYGTATTAMTRSQSHIYKNGAVAATATAGSYSTTVSFCSVTDIIYANGSTDYFEAYANFLGTGTVTVQTDAKLTYFVAALIRPA